MTSRHHCISGNLKLLPLWNVVFCVWMLAYIPLIAGEVIAASAVLLSRKLTRMAHKSVPQNIHHECRQKIDCGISLAVAVEFSTCYHKLLFCQCTVLSLQLHTSINFWLFQFSVCGCFKNHLIYTVLNETDYFHG